jgi:thiamine pyrophosphokinase
MVLFMSRAVIFLNGNIPDPGLIRPLIGPGDTLLAADGGTRHILKLNLDPSIVIGDLDSLSDEDRQHLKALGTKIICHPRDKNKTDFELTLDYAVEAGFRKILVIAALGGRLDMTLGNLSLLATPSLADLDIRMDDGVEETFFTRSSCQITGDIGDIVSLIPWGEEVLGVVTSGLRWPLLDETLYPTQTRGISNELLLENASVSTSTGLLLIVHKRTRYSNSGASHENLPG